MNRRPLAQARSGTALEGRGGSESCHSRIDDIAMPNGVPMAHAAWEAWRARDECVA